MRILGLSAFYHDSAAALVEDGAIVAAVQEERFSRLKHDARFPRQSAAWCLSRASGTVDAVVYYEKPLLKFERILSTAAAVAPRGFRAFAAAMPVWLRERLWMPGLIEDELRALGCPDVPVYFCGHHEAHAASAFFPSPFDRAAILTLDGVGEWTTTALGRGSGNSLELLSELRFPHSLGLLYSAFTHHCGFRVNSGEYKLMGLAPYGQPRFVGLIRRHLVDLRDDGSFRLNAAYFGYLRGQRMTTAEFAALFNCRARLPDEPLEQIHCDLARSIQEVTEEIVLRLARTLHRETEEENLCMAGGVALNCVANARLLRDGPFRSIWVQPAAGDAGGALGAALAFHHLACGGGRALSGLSDAMRGALLGPAYTEGEIREVLSAHGVQAQSLEMGALRACVVERLLAGDVVGWFQGPAEFGPRALGARSILADARDPAMQRRLNLKIKFRESFRPFAPVVLAEETGRWFEMAHPSPYMLFTAPVAAAQRLPVPDGAGWAERLGQIRSSIPAVTHVDFSARVQTVDREIHPELHAVLRDFAAASGCPVLVNTSFNVRGEPPVCHPREALEGFLATEMDCLALGPFFLEKRSLPESLARRPAAPRTFIPD